MKRSFFPKPQSCRYWWIDALHGRKLNVWRKSLKATTQECCEQYWTSPEGSTPQSSSLPPIKKTIKIRRTRHAGHCWRSRDELINDILQWTPSYGRAGRPGRTYIQQLCVDTGSDGRLIGVAGEGQGYPCWQHVMILMNNLNFAWTSKSSHIYRYTCLASGQRNTSLLYDL